MTVQIKTMSKTLLARKQVHGGKGWITKGKDADRQVPRQQCRRRTQRGDTRPLDRGVLQERPGHLHHVDSRREAAHKDFWSVFVNGKSSNKGICDIKLRAGQRLLFKIVK